MFVDDCGIFHSDDAIIDVDVDIVVNDNAVDTEMLFFYIC